MRQIVRRVVAPAAAVSALAVSLAVLSSPGAEADSPCVVGGYTPREVSAGLDPVVVTFVPAVSGCTLAGWSIDGGDYDFYTDDVTPQATFAPTSNTETAPEDVVVSSYSSDFENTVAAYPKSFVLKRDTEWDRFNAAPEPVRKGENITIKGRLRRANWETRTYIGCGSRKVAVEFRTKSGGYRRITTAKTNSRGYLTVKVPAARDGYWRLRYGGNSAAGASRVAGDFVDVR